MNRFIKPQAELALLRRENIKQPPPYFFREVHVTSPNGSPADHSRFEENQDEILDKLGASRLLKISSRTLDDWMRKKRVPYSKLPSGTVRFRRSQLLAFITKYEVA